MNIDVKHCSLSSLENLESNVSEIVLVKNKMFK